MPAVYDELIDFIAHGNTTEQVAAFAPSAATQSRAYELLSKEKSDTISPNEKRELDAYTQMEMILGLAKAKAKLFLKQEVRESRS